MNFKKLRRSGRISKSVPILLIGSDTDGRVFSEETRTVIISSHKLLAEQELILRSLETGRETEIRVVGEIAAQEDKHTYGVAFLDEDLDFWQMEFPPPPSLQERPLELVLECNACGSTVTLLNGDYEFDVCAIHGGLVRNCTECGFATIWKRSEGGGAAKTKLRPKPVLPARPSALLEDLVTEPQRTDAPEVKAETELFYAHTEPTQIAEVLASEVQKLTAQRTSVAVDDRRLRVRAKVNYFACVRSEAFGDDVVTCIDMSRGGLGFWTKHSYAISAAVKIAVPFAPESPNAPAIFVPARVVNIAEAAERKMFRCGVMFLPARGAQAHM